MSKSTESPLIAAVSQLDADLRRFEQLSLELGRSPINSEKSLQRARQALEACSSHETKLAESLRAFAEAMQGVQKIQHACMDATAQAAKRISERHAERAQLQDRLAALGESARAVSAPVTELPESDGSPSSQMLGPLGEVERRLEAVIAEASELCELSRQGDWADLERDTQSLREQLQALRNRVLLTRRKLVSDAPS
jgi:DNA repair exonuclease SbcCD ATPase subunit